jgi:peroxiredoxin
MENATCLFVKKKVVKNHKQKAPGNKAGSFPNKMKNCSIVILIVCFSAITVSSKAQLQPNITDPRLDFTLPDVNGDSIRLSSLKGKVLLLDFWASWCVPCRFSNKGLVKLYSRYKDKGFEIYGVSLDDNKKSWQKAIEKDKVKWMQVNDPMGWYALAATKWGIEAIPTSFLIDKNGNVIAINPEKQELETKLKQLLGL